MKWFSIDNKVKDVLNININDEIGGNGITSNDFIAYVQDAGKKNINLTIDSPGGSVFDAFAIYDFLTTSDKYNVTVEIRGLAASSASVLALAGNKLPTMTENSFLMIHNPYLTKMDVDYYDSEKLKKKAAEMLNEAELLETITNKIATIYSKRTGIDHAKLIAMMDKETWISAEDALEMGFASSVSESIAIAAKLDSAKLSDLRMKNAPKQFVINNNQVNMDELSKQVSDLKDFISNLFPKKEGEAVKEVKILDNADVKAKLEAIQAEIEEKEKDIEEKDAKMSEKDEALTALETANAVLTDEIAKLKGTEEKPEAEKDPEPVEKETPDAKVAFGNSVLANLIENRYNK